MLLTCYPLAELIKYNVSLFLAIKVSQKAQRRNDSYRRLTKKKLFCHRMGISALKVPGHRLCRLISYLFYPPGAYLLPFDPAFSNTSWDGKEESWGFEMQNIEVWDIYRRFCSHCQVLACPLLCESHHYYSARVQKVALFPWSKEDIIFPPGLSQVNHVLLMLSNERKLPTTEPSTNL